MSLEPLRSDPDTEISLSDIRALSAIAAAESGISVGDDKGHFLVARLGPELARLGLDSYAAYAARLADPASAAERRRFVEALTTHTTSFFREKGQYDWLEADGLALVLGTHPPAGRRLAIWSAACSSGQELYSAMMVAASHPLLSDRRVEIAGIGTDLSRPILRRAATAVYTRQEIEGIPDAHRRRFLLMGREDRDRFRIAPALRERARWARANLAEASGLADIAADIAFLRNILIYFEPVTRERVLRTVVGRIAPGGVLLTGHSEAIEAARYGLRPIRPSIYRKEP